MHSICLYRLPNEDVVYELQGTAAPFVASNTPNYGFVFAPFDDKENTLILSGKAMPFVSKKIQFNLLDEAGRGMPKTQYEALTTEAIDQIKSRSFAKLVTARNYVMSKPEDFDPVGFFQTLCDTYKQALIYLWYAPQTGLWIGATPEVLIQNKDNLGHTMALAGTRAKDDNSDFTDKERDEQQWVYQFIEEKLTELGCLHIVKEPVKPFTAGNLVHLINRITFDIQPNQSRWDILRGIHPTPAVCGYPQTAAKAFILAHEKLNRKFYSGYLGPFTAKRMHMYVNLRCMQVHRNKLELFAGAGITALSNPQLEWEETNEKLKTLLNWL